MIIHLKHSAGMFRKIVRSTDVDAVVQEIDELCRKVRRSGFGIGTDLVPSFVFVELLAWSSQKDAERWASELKTALKEH